MKMCHRCGAENPTSSESCWNCFSQISTSSMADQQDNKETCAANRRINKEEKPKPSKVARKSIPLKIILPIIVILGFGGFATWKFVLNPTPEKLVKAAVMHYFNAIGEGKLAAASELLTAESKSIMPLDQAANNPKAQQMTQFMPKMKDVKFGNISTTDMDAIVEVTATAEMNNPATNNKMSITNTQTIYLLKENDTWKIDLARNMLEQFRKMPKDQLVKIRPFFATGGPQTAGMLRLVDKALKGQ